MPWALRAPPVSGELCPACKTWARTLLLLFFFIQVSFLNCQFFGIEIFHP